MGILRLERGNLLLERSYLLGEFSAQMDNLVDGVVSLLELVNGLELLLYLEVRIVKVLLQGNESLPLVYRRLDFLDFLGGSHIFVQLSELSVKRVAKL